MLDEVRSQAAVAWLNRRLWTLPQLARAVQLPKSWWFDRDGTAPTPIAACHYITFACPEACTFCNTTHAIDDWARPLDDTQQAALIDKLVPRIPTIAVGGGEPMAHPGILDHYARIKRRGGRIFTVTSGTSLGPSKAKKLAAIGPDVIMFSLLGDETAHDHAMGRDGAWQRSLAGLSNFLTERDPRRTKVLVNCAVSFENPTGLRAIVDHARRLGADGVRFTWLSYLSESERATEAHKVNYHIVPDTIVAAFDPTETLREAEALERDFAGYVAFLPRLDAGDRAEWYTEGGGVNRRCHSLWHTMFLRPDGAVVPCGHLFEEPVGNLLTDDLDTVWNHPRLKAVRRAQWEAPFAVCRRCCKV